MRKRKLFFLFFFFFLYLSFVVVAVVVAVLVLLVVLLLLSCQLTGCKTPIYLLTYSLVDFVFLVALLSLAFSSHTRFTKERSTKKIPPAL